MRSNVVWTLKYLLLCTTEETTIVQVWKYMEAHKSWQEFHCPIMSFAPFQNLSLHPFLDILSEYISHCFYSLVNCPVLKVLWVLWSQIYIYSDFTIICYTVVCVNEAQYYASFIYLLISWIFKSKVKRAFITWSGEGASQQWMSSTV